MFFWRNERWKVDVVVILRATEFHSLIFYGAIFDEDWKFQIIAHGMDKLTRDTEDAPRWLEIRCRLKISLMYKRDGWKMTRIHWKFFDENWNLDDTTLSYIYGHNVSCWMSCVGGFKVSRWQKSEMKMWEMWKWDDYFIIFVIIRLWSFVSSSEHIRIENLFKFSQANDFENILWTNGKINHRA